MRTIIENPVYMTFEEMEKEFIGKWVYIAKSNFTPHSKLLGGFPVVVADKILESYEDGLYKSYRTPENAPVTYWDFNYNNIPELPNLFFIDSEPIGKKNAFGI